MKNSILLLSLFCCLNCFSQNPNPALFQNWYLRFIQSSDLSTPYTVSQFQPQISPTLIISSDLSYNGQGACNSFSGSFASATTDSFWQTNSFSNSTASCSSQNQDFFESGYFSFMQSGGWYQITSEGIGLVLTMNNPIFGQAVFQNFPLKNSEFDLAKVSIHPNPASSVVYLDSGQLAISKIQIVNSLGQNIKTINANFEVLNIADLSSGIYILKIDTEFGTVSRKIIRE
ncbi:T9SS type A sorting domain-containing protein [Flavobacterium wongokense]|uniref:T9SS type A sorting domain-containing protein n=1 Tax=Flavobacterium wongokense TaxID=2910674 RepID=UPI001F211067|nr:T9SS type A sorting domain-containing protein [Flavobacterium sp. WG47]MCF6133422.1 T9SS type A sorting domain-containing protein [Flavobacterium sp. WG47]